MNLLCLNPGSTSIKASWFDLPHQMHSPPFRQVTLEGTDIESWFERCAVAPELVAIRLVHGGTIFTSTREFWPHDLKRLSPFLPLAPNHLPITLRALELALERWPNTRLFVCPDSEFHRTMLPEAKTLPLPENVRAQGISRLGFHGLSFQSIIHQLEPDLPEKLIIAHLGGGSSLCAIRNGESIDTTMGFTPLGGLPMGTRSGDVDPGILLHLLRQGKSLDSLETLLTQESGLLGLSGISADLRDLSPDSLAVSSFCYAVQKGIGAMITALGGLDLLVFTGGVGENQPLIRDRITSTLESLPLHFSTRVLPSRESVAMADTLRPWLPED
ncbi:MAG: acetate kinase [Verrucomicrobiota bacterium]